MTCLHVCVLTYKIVISETSTKIDLNVILYTSTAMTFLLSLAVGFFVGVFSALGWHGCKSKRNNNKLSTRLQGVHSFSDNEPSYDHLSSRNN